MTMPRQKDLKRLVRARMHKTGEAYTSARAHVLAKPRIKPRSSAATAPAVETVVAAKQEPTPQDYATLAGMSDAVIKKNTGCSWERWVHALDNYGAAAMSHRDIATLIRTKYKTPSWWTQSVAVGYERIRGLRARGQQRDGTFGATKSRTFNVPVSTLFDAWVDAGVRKRWLNGASVKVRTATAPKTMRLDWTDGSIIAVGFTSKGKSKSAVALEHSKLPDRDAVTAIKEYWSERFDALAEVLANE
jgi:uncharacterized protein YndB with AHSA1/START domain